MIPNSTAPFAFDDALAAAQTRIEACVIIGGSLFSDRSSFAALIEASDRGVALRILFPSPRSNWLQGFAESARLNVPAYRRSVLEMKRHVATALPNVSIRWYDAPGPCWFTLVDRDVLYTKPFDATRETFPTPERRREHIDHFGLLFDQLWERSIDDFKSPPSIQSIEPVVRIIGMSPEIIHRLAANPSSLAHLSPEAFEQLIANRLTLMGLGVQRIGSANTRDGGIDMIAWPERNASVPYLLAVQAKHSRRGRAVNPATVRDFRGVLATTPIDIGLLVTNTIFTPDARWAASQGPHIVRLRDFDDLARWLRADFATESFGRDLPSTISLGPGLRIEIGPTHPTATKSQL